MIERVIIIDDEPATRFIMKLNIKQMFQIEAICFETIEIEKDILISNKSTLYILDQNLINGNGDEFLKQNYELISDQFIIYFGKESDFEPIEKSKRFIYAEKSDLTTHLKAILEYEI
jgi:response regulator of citrate/malate metabolism